MRALSTLLARAGADVRVVDPRVSPAPFEAAAVVVADEVPGPEWLAALQHTAVLLDCGYYLTRRPSWLTDEIAERIGVYLPQYGNVGPLTVARLAEATVRAASMR